MAWRGWKSDQAGQGDGNRAAHTADLIAADLKLAQRPAGIVIQPSSHNDSQYGSTGPWRVEGEVETVKLPAFKFSIASTRGITITVKQPDIKIFSTAGVLHAHAVSYRDSSLYYYPARKILEESNGPRGEERLNAFSEEWEKLKRGIERIANAFNYDKSDLQSDYFNVGFYLTVKLDSKLAEGNQALAEKTISALEVAFPETWVAMLAEAANEQLIDDRVNKQIAEGYWTGPKVQTTRRDILEQSARRALEAVAAGTFKVPFNPTRQGWGRRHSRSGRGEYFHRGKKLKVGLLRAIVGAEPGQSVAPASPSASGVTAQWPVGPAEHEWFVTKYSSARGGTYREQELIARNVADSLEAAINAADAALGYAPGGN